MSNDITIHVSNKDAGNQFILVFQKPTDTHEMFNTLFPTAWKILPLADGSSQVITYPVQLEIMVKESQPDYDATDRGTTKDTAVGQLWAFSIDNDFPNLQPRAGKTVAGLMGCVNNATQKVDVGLSKNNTPLVVKRKVAQGDTAQFELTPKLYLAYVNDIQQGDLIKSDVSETKVFEVDLTNIRSIDVELSMADPNTGLKQWKSSNIISAS